jgi:MTA/SAH nucleosidase
MIGIIGAVVEEAEAIKKEIKEIKEIKETVISGISFFTGKFNDKDVVFVQSGIGKVNAAITATLLIEKFKVSEVIFSGVAGSLDERLKVGDVVIGRDIVQHDVDATAFGYKMGQIPQMKEWAFESDKELVEKAGNVNDFDHRIFFGRILTGDQFVSKKDVKIRLGKDFEALCVDMESGAVAQVCTRLGVKFLIIRSISDSITDESDMEYETFVKLAAKNSTRILKEITL